MERTSWWVVVAVVAVAVAAVAEGAGECGKMTTPDMEAFRLVPCASAAQDENSSVSSRCCAQVKRIGRNPKCLCAVMLSNTAKSSGVDPEIAITIPKRCNLPDRPIGYKCGGLFDYLSYTLYYIYKVDDRFIDTKKKRLDLDTSTTRSYR